MARKQTATKGQLQRRAVLDAAAKLFSERGFGGTNMLDVAKALNVSRPAVYYYFSNKESILSALVEEVTVHSEQLAAAIAKVKAEPVDALYEMVWNYASFVMTNPLIFRTTERDEIHLDDNAKTVSKRAKRALLDQFRLTVDRAIKAGKFRPVDPGVAALAIIGMCNWCAWWFVPKGRLSHEQIADQLADMAVSSLLNGEGMPDRRRLFLSALADAETALARLEKLARR
ncbi:MAG: TetR/AcrR family transcriptional regulator [Burkholderiaceae bacterium]|nr:TetR/AcrR family transcriptional regulator [Burkholderiaceae bacterium]